MQHENKFEKSIKKWKRKDALERKLGLRGHTQRTKSHVGNKKQKIQQKGGGLQVLKENGKSNTIQSKSSIKSIIH